jgi:hypothetical protein
MRPIYSFIGICQGLFYFWSLPFELGRVVFGLNGCGGGSSSNSNPAYSLAVSALNPEGRITSNVVRNTSISENYEGRISRICSNISRFSGGTAGDS